MFGQRLIMHPYSRRVHHQPKNQNLNCLLYFTALYVIIGMNLFLQMCSVGCILGLYYCSDKGYEELGRRIGEAENLRSEKSLEIIKVKQSI